MEEKLKRRQDNSIRGRGTFHTSKQSNKEQEGEGKCKDKSFDFKGGFRGSRGRFGGKVTSR